MLNFFKIKSLSAKLYSGLFVFLSLICILSVLNWHSLQQSTEIQHTLMHKNIPALVQLTAVIQQSERLIKSAPNLISASSPEELKKVQQEIEKSTHTLKHLIDELEKFDREEHKEDFIETRKMFQQTTDHLQAIEASVIEKNKYLSLMRKTPQKKGKAFFDLKQKIFNIEKQQKNYLKHNKEVSSILEEKVQLLSQDIQEDNKKASLFFEKILYRSKMIVLTVSIAGLVSAVGLAFFFIAPLIRRLSYLSQRMRDIPQGKWWKKISVTGAEDEVHEMAEALEKLRQYTLEVQRINLVKKLAKEVEDKNQELEKTIQDLHKTRGQLVQQEKLASLGQLTAGIAHEIKNPLNFVNNFSELSGEIAKELEEEMNHANMDSKKQSEIKELLQNLKSNMEKIKKQGQRISGIITGMLEHSRGKAGQLELVDINKCLDTYSQLALTSKRSLDSSFNVSFKKDYDTTLKPIKAVPQDISRAVLNIISNACDAVHEKKIKDHKPLIVLKTRKTLESVQISIKDNGMGISKELQKKIFNPFFTTKPTGQGTGLGLSLSHDIIVKHGGSIQVQSQSSEFTEFIITLPVKT